MSYNLNIAGFNYPLPSQSERNWSAQVNDFFTAVATKLLQKSGGSFTLTADVDFGATNGALLAYIKSKTSTSIPATGWLRLDKADRLTFRNILNNADMPMGLSQSSGRFQVGVPTAFTALAATDVFTSSGRVPVVGETVQVQSFSGTGITLGATYYATTIVGDTFKLYTSLGGPTFVDVTLDGSGVFIVQDDIVTSGSVDTLQNKLARDFAYGSEVGTISGNSINTTSGKVIQRITSITGSAELWQINFPTDGKVYVFVNETGADFALKNNLGAATRSIYTPGGIDFTVKTNAAVTLVYDTGLTAWVVAGGGSGSSGGSGIKNYIASPNGITGWVSNDITKITVALEAAAANLPDNASQTSGIKITRVSGNDGYVRVRWNMDTVDYGVLGQFLIDAKTAAVAGGYELQLWSDPTSSYAASVQMSMSAFAFPTGTSKFNPWAQAGASAAPYMEMRIVARTTAGVLPLYLNNVTYTPGIVQQNTPGGPWESTTSYTIGADTTPPTPGTSPTYYRRTYRDGEYAVIRWEFSQTGAGTAGSGNYRLPLPTGLTVDASKLGVATSSGYARVVSSTGFFNNSTTFLNIIGYALGGTSYVYGLVGNDATSPATGFGSTGGALSGAGTTVFALEARLPIAEWAGQVMASGAGANVTYASNNGTNTALDDTTSFVSGSSQFIAYTAEHSKDVQLPYPLQNGLRPVMEVTSDGGTTWLEVGQNNSIVAAYDGQNGIGYGMLLQSLSSTKVRVTFGQYRRNFSATYGGVGTAWSGIAGSNTYQWRVNVANPSAPVGVLPAGIDGSPGYAQAGKIPGSVLGTAIAAGYIGEVKTFNLTSVTNWPGSTGQFANILTLDNSNLGAGIWLINGVCTIQPNGATAFSVAYGSVSDYSNNTTTDHSYPSQTQFDISNSGTVAGSAGIVMFNGCIVNISSSGTKYLKCRADFSAGTPQYRYAIRAVRIA